MELSRRPVPPSRSHLLRRIRALEAQVQTLTAGGPSGAPGDEDAEAAEVHELIASGRPLAAARRYREITGVSEAEAGDAIRRLGGDIGGDA
ncbi:MAG: hypothetical protein ITG02_00165 [Patulibacter sp.]|nr:hypothetical protein [Patulibacter sp.]